MIDHFISLTPEFTKALPNGFLGSVVKQIYLSNQSIGRVYRSFVGSVVSDIDGYARINYFEIELRKLIYETDRYGDSIFVSISPVWYRKLFQPRIWKNYERYGPLYTFYEKAGADTFGLVDIRFNIDRVPIFSFYLSKKQLSLKAYPSAFDFIRSINSNTNYSNIKLGYFGFGDREASFLTLFGLTFRKLDDVTLQIIYWPVIKEKPQEISIEEYYPYSIASELIRAISYFGLVPENYVASPASFLFSSNDFTISNLQSSYVTIEFIDEDKLNTFVDQVRVKLDAFFTSHSRFSQTIIFGPFGYSGAPWDVSWDFPVVFDTRVIYKDNRYYALLYERILTAFKFIFCADLSLLDIVGNENDAQQYLEIYKALSFYSSRLSFIPSIDEHFPILPFPRFSSAAADNILCTSTVSSKEADIVETVTSEPAMASLVQEEQCFSLTIVGEGIPYTPTLFVSSPITTTNTCYARNLFTYTLAQPFVLNPNLVGLLVGTETDVISGSDVILLIQLKTETPTLAEIYTQLILSAGIEAFTLSVMRNFRAIPIVAISFHPRTSSLAQVNYDCYLRAIASVCHETQTEIDAKMHLLLQALNVTDTNVTSQVSPVVSTIHIIASTFSLFTERAEEVIRIIEANIWQFSEANSYNLLIQSLLSLVVTASESQANVQNISTVYIVSDSVTDIEGRVCPIQYSTVSGQTQSISLSEFIPTPILLYFDPFSGTVIHCSINPKLTTHTLASSITESKGLLDVLNELIVFGVTQADTSGSHIRPILITNVNAITTTYTYYLFEFHPLSLHVIVYEDSIAQVGLEIKGRVFSNLVTASLVDIGHKLIDGIFVESVTSVEAPSRIDTHQKLEVEGVSKSELVFHIALVPVKIDILPVNILTATDTALIGDLLSPLTFILSPYTPTIIDAIMTNNVEIMGDISGVADTSTTVIITNVMTALGIPRIGWPLDQTTTYIMPYYAY
ncbi:MAG: hypothetical protein ABIK73_07200 [candidate division WOR-3 bacterium]